MMVFELIKAKERPTITVNITPDAIEYALTVLSALFLIGVGYWLLFRLEDKKSEL